MHNLLTKKDLNSGLLRADRDKTDANLSVDNLQRNKNVLILLTRYTVEVVWTVTFHKLKQLQIDLLPDCLSSGFASPAIIVQQHIRCEFKLLLSRYDRSDPHFELIATGEFLRMRLERCNW